MSARAIWEATGKDLINRNLPDSSIANKCRFAVYDGSSSWEQLIEKEPWLQTEVLCNRVIIQAYEQDHKKKLFL